MVADSLYCKTNMAATMSRALFLETNTFNIAAIPTSPRGESLCMISSLWHFFCTFGREEMYSYHPKLC